MVLQQLVHEAIATTNALQQKAFGTVVEQKVVAQGGVAIPGEDEAQGEMLKQCQPTTLKGCKPNDVKDVTKKHLRIKASFYKNIDAYWKTQAKYTSE